MARVAEKISDGRVLALIESFLRQDIMKGMERWTPATGTPQGLSSLLCWPTPTCTRSIVLIPFRCDTLHENNRNNS